MKNNPIKFLFILLSIFALNFSFSKATAQDTIKNQVFQKYYYVHPSIGLSQYFGDINPDNLYNMHLKFGIGAALGYQLTPIFGLRFDLMKTKLYSEKESIDKKLSSDLFDMGLNLSVNINDIFAAYNPNRPTNFYLLGGIGFSLFKSKLESFKTSAIINEHSSRQSEFVIPFGAGASFRLSDNLALSLEYLSRFTANDDKLDFWKATKANDWYSYASVGLQVKLGPFDRDKARVTSGY